MTILWLSIASLSAIAQLSYNQSLVDSLDQEIEILKEKLPHLKKSQNPALYFTRIKLDQLKLARAYEDYLYNEELDQAKMLIKERIKRAQYRRDGKSEEFYSNYLKRVNADLKSQKIRYQKLFSKEKNFKKAFKKLVKQDNEESFLRAKRMTELAMKYANEKNLIGVTEYLKEYDEYINALLYDANSTYNLQALTRNENSFNAVFLPMVSSDSLEMIKEAGNLVENCFVYAGKTLSILDTSFFVKQRNAVSTALTEYYDEQSRNKAYAILTNQAIKARLDSLNNTGVYKWKDYIVVIDYFRPSSGFESVKKGEAIIDADRKLYRYIEDNELGNLRKGMKVGPAFLISYVERGEKVKFLFDPHIQMFQYIVCYTKVFNNYYTQEISRYMPPLTFEKEAMN